MNDFETALMIDKIKSQKYGKYLIEDIITMKTWYNANVTLKDDVFYTPLCNAYKCITLAISLYITKCSSPLPMYVYQVKHSMEKKILSEEFLNTDKPTYEWLIDTFQYTVDIPASTPNSEYTQESDKQVGVRHNLNYVVFNKVALLIGNKTIPFTIDFNSSLVGYHGYLLPGISGKPYYTMVQLILIQTLKDRADSNITYTLFEEALDMRLEWLLAFKTPVSFIETTEPLRETIRAMKALHPRYLIVENKH